MPERSGGSSVAVMQRDSHGHALNDLHPVAGRVLRGQQRELGTGCFADALHGSLPFETGVGVDAHLNALVGAQVGEIGFLEVRLDPHVAVGDETHHRVAAFDVRADFRFLAGDAGERRDHVRALQIERGLIAIGPRLLIARMRLDGDVGIAVQVDQDLRGALAREFLLLQRGIERVFCIVEIRDRADLAIDETRPAGRTSRARTRRCSARVRFPRAPVGTAA